MVSDVVNLLHPYVEVQVMVRSMPERRVAIDVTNRSVTADASVSTRELLDALAVGSDWWLAPDDNNSFFCL